MKKNLCHTKAACACFMTSILLFGYAFSPLTSLEMNDNFAAAFGAEDETLVALETAQIEEAKQPEEAELLELNESRETAGPTDSAEPPVATNAGQNETLATLTQSPAGATAPSSETTLGPRGDIGISPDPDRTIKFNLVGLPVNNIGNTPVNKYYSEYREDPFERKDISTNSRGVLDSQTISEIESRVSAPLYWEFSDGIKVQLNFKGWTPTDYMIRQNTWDYRFTGGQAAEYLLTECVLTSPGVTPGYLINLDSYRILPDESEGQRPSLGLSEVQLFAVYEIPNTVSVILGIFESIPGSTAINEEMILLEKGASLSQTNKKVKFIQTTYPANDDRWSFVSTNAYSQTTGVINNFPFDTPLTENWALRYVYKRNSTSTPTPSKQPANVPVAGDTGIQAKSSTIPSGSTMDASENPAPENKAKLEDEIKKANDGNTIPGVKFYEVNLKNSSGQNIHDGFGEIELSIPVDPKYNGYSFTVWHLHQNGTITSHKVIAMGGFVTFTVTDLSSFAYALTPESAQQTPAAQNPQDPAKQTTAGLTNTGDTLRDTLPKTSDNLKMGYMLIATVLAMTAGFLLVGSSVAQFARKKLTQK